VAILHTPSGLYPTIESALLAAGPGDEVWIAGGTYNPPAAGYVVSGGVLIRPEATAALVVINAPAAAQDTWRIHAAGVELRDLDTTAWPAFGCEAYAINADGVILTRCIARHNSRGFYATAALNATIDSCRAIGGAGAESGVRLDGAGGTIVNTFVSGTHTHGIRLSVAATVNHCTVVGCVIEGYSLHGAVLVRDCVAEANPGIGFHLHHAAADVDWVCAHANGTNTDVVAGTLGGHVTNADPKLTTDDAFEHDSILRDFDAAGVGVLVDRVGTVRPVNGSFDLGSWEWPGVAPTVLSARCPDLSHVVVTFDQAMAPATVETAAEWTIAALTTAGAVTVLSAESDGAADVRLTTTTHTGDAVYRVTAPATAESAIGDPINPAADTADYATPTPPRLSDTLWGFLAEPTVDDAEAVRPLLHQAVLIALFTDARALPEDGDPLRDADPRGWPGDHYAPAGRPALGSRIWTRLQGRADAKTASEIQDFARVALAGLVDEGLATAVDAVTTLVPATLGGRALKLTVTVDGQPLVFSDLWAAWRAFADAR
jgi:phage gp46-like protein